MGPDVWALARQGDAEACGALVEAYRGLVRGVVRSLRIPATAVADHEDLFSAGIVGLLDAVRRYEPARGVPFEAYAAARIRGAVLDEIRGLDAHGREAWRKARLVRAAADAHAALHGEAPTLAQLAAATGLDPHGVAAGLRARASFTVSLDLLVDSGAQPGWAAADDPEAPLMQRDLVDDLRSAVRSLPERERSIVDQYYGEALTLREIGTRMGVSEARVCQLHARAISQLRRLVATPSPAALA